MLNQALVNNSPSIDRNRSKMAIKLLYVSMNGPNTHTNDEHSRLPRKTSHRSNDGRPR